MPPENGKNIMKLIKTCCWKKCFITSNKNITLVVNLLRHNNKDTILRYTNVGLRSCGTLYKVRYLDEWITDNECNFTMSMFILQKSTIRIICQLSIRDTCKNAFWIPCMTAGIYPGGWNYTRLWSFSIHWCGFEVSHHLHL